jgi:hypothetical protein
MINKFKKYFLLGILLFLIVLALLARFYKPGSLPSSLNRDEAALGYNAFLLKEVGLDEWSRPWNFTLESFGDYKLTGYPATLVLAFSLLGEHDWVVRLPSLLAGVWLLVIAYKISRWLKLKPILSLMVVFLLSTTPVFYFYSRVAYEAHLALAFFLSGYYLLVKDLSVKSWLDKETVLGFILLMAACLIYNTPLLILPALLPVLFVLSRKIDKKTIARWLGVVLVMLFMVIALWPVLTQKSGITIFTDETIWANWITQRESMQGIEKLVMGSKYVNWVKLMGGNFISSFSYKFLVTEGGNHPWHSIPGWGHLSWMTYILGLVGMVSLGFKIKNKQNKNRAAFLLLMLLSLAPAVVTVDAPHTTRSLVFIFGWVVMAGIGIERVLKYKKMSKLLLALVILLQVNYFSSYVSSYWTNFKTEQISTYQDGFEEVVAKLENDHPNTAVAIVDPSGYQYILLAWYLKMDPSLYLESNIRQLPDTIGMRYGEQVGRYHFIGVKADRKADEKVLVGWHEKKKKWIIYE